MKSSLLDMGGSKLLSYFQKGEVYMRYLVNYKVYNFSQ